MKSLTPIILAVDDNASVLELVRAYLEDESYRARTAEDGTSGQAEDSSISSRLRSQTRLPVA